MNKPIVIAIICTLLSPLALAQPCSDKVYQELLQPATAKKRATQIQCDLTLKGTETISKRLLFMGEKSSNLTVNCNGATLNGGEGSVNDGIDMIEVRSRLKADGSWSAPSNITFKNCNINGSLRVWGMGKNGEAKPVKASSLTKEHTDTVRSNAPHNIHFDKISITGTRRVPFYLGPGVHDVSLTNSVIQGNSVSVAIYLDTESTKNTISNNVIKVKTTHREQMAIDGSSHNVIRQNYFGSLNNGGIYLYRNCGEGGTIRHSSATHNLIQNNTFYYKDYSPFWSWIFGREPTIYLGSRDGGKYYCDYDEGYDLGSSKSDKDYTRYNIIAQNKVFDFEPTEMFIENTKTDKPNYFFSNKKVSSPENEPNGCILMINGLPGFLASGETADTATRETCINGKLQ